MAPSDELLHMLETRIARHSVLKWQKTATSLRIEAINTTGFTVTLWKTDDGWGVALGDHGFHEHFDEPDDDPLEFIAWCYSGLSRLREIRYGTVVGRTVLERLEGDEYHVVSTTGLIFFPFWRKRSESLLQNPILLQQL
jgi:hypothetical protein